MHPRGGLMSVWSRCSPLNEYICRVAEGFGLGDFVGQKPGWIDSHDGIEKTGRGTRSVLIISIHKNKN